MFSAAGSLRSLNGVASSVTAIWTQKANPSLAMPPPGALKGGDGGPAIVPGKPDESLLLEMISGDKPAMPQKSKPLSREEVKQFWLRIRS